MLIKDRSEVSKRHVFPQGVLVAITLLGSGAGDGGARARTRCESGLLLCLVADTILLGTRSGPKVLKQKH